jgi:YYY domain-containing protein
MLELFAALRWLLVLSAAGWWLYPLAFRLFSALPGRGVAFVRPLGLLVWGFGFWLLGSLGVLRNDLGGEWLALAAALGVAWWWARRDQPGAAGAWLKENTRLVIAVEVVFFVAFALVSFLRALYPDVTFTEKPMELAFINAALRSPTLPPHDPWLSGYAISYYYFGYVMTAMLARLSAVPAGLAFNLMIASVFAMAAAGAYGLVADLLAAWRGQHEGRSLWLAALAPLFAFVVSNVEGLLEMLHARGAFWSFNEEGGLVSRFWTWLDIKDLYHAPSLTDLAGPTRNWWWWRASRVINDRNFLGAEVEVIDEFPFFSLYLGDLHPHVLAMPFVMLALAFALNYFLGGGRGESRFGPWRLAFDRTTLWFGALLLGGLAFLNIWDFPIYLGFFTLVYIYVRVRSHGWAEARLWEGMQALLAVGVLAVALYLPFHLSFSSQAGGALPNLLNPTRGAQLWVMFGTLFVPLLVFLLYLTVQRAGLKGILVGVFSGLALAAGLWAASMLLALAIALVLPAVTGSPGAADLLAGLTGAPDFDSLVRAGLERRVLYAGGWLTLAALAGLALAGLLPRRAAAPEKNPGHAFALGLALFGTLLALAPEFVYLRDQFGHRMNTVFKFFFQAWLVWSLAAAYASAVLLSGPRRGARLAFAGLLILVMSVGLIYPAYGLSTRLREFEQAGRQLTLDGTAHFTYLSPDDHAAVAWLLDQPLGTLVEAVGGSYTHYARISAHSGQPALLGWPGHESQWRGGGAEMGSRQSDIERLYSTAAWEEARALLEFYGVRYIYVGSLERTTYAVDETKFALFLPVLFQQGEVTIYGVPADLAGE